MGVYTRPNSPYYWVYIEGTRQRFSTGLRIKAATPALAKENRRQAEAIYDASKGDVARDRFELPSTKAARLFEPQARWYLEHHTVKHGGALQEARKIEHLIAFFGTYALDAISPTLWAEYETKRTRDDKVSIATVGRELAIMKLILNTAIGSYIEYHLLGQVKRKSPKLPAKRTMTRREEPAFLRTLKQIDPELHDMYLVGVGTLLRQSNLVYLQRHEHRGDRLVIGDTKTGAHQISLTGPTELQRRAAAVLKRRMPNTPDGWFFPRWKAIFTAYRDPGQAGTRLRNKVRRAAAVAGLPWGLKQGGVVWHTLTRASGATRLIREHRIDVRTVQLIGGWASLDQMAEYLGLALDLTANTRATA